MTLISKTEKCLKVLIMLLFLAVQLSGYGTTGQILMAEDITHSRFLEDSLDTRISLDLRDMDVVDVYKFLALRGDFNISISKNIEGRVTLYLQDVSIRDAMDIISISNDLAYRTIGENIIHIMTEDEYQSMYGKRFNDKRVVRILRLNYIKPSYALETLKNIKSEIGKVVIDEDTGSIVMIDIKETVEEMEETLKNMDRSMEVHVYDLKYANADDVAAKLKDRLDNKAVGSTQADTRSNQIIVRAFPDRMKEAEAIIKALDTKTRAVRIDLRIIKIVLRPGFEMGIDWSTFFDTAHKLTLAGSFPITSSISSTGTLGQIAVGNVGIDDFTAGIKMLKTVSATKVLASPTIMVTNNQEASIHIGDKLAYVTTTTIGTGDSQRVNEEIHYIDVGIKFKVTPVINDDGFVTMKIAPEISSKSGELETTQGAKVPLINTTTLDTEVLIKDGHTIIIAGLRQTNTTDTKKGLPGMMDIPWLGKFFANVSKADIKTEIAIFMTPHIVSGTEDVTEQRIENEKIEDNYKVY